MPSVPRRGVGVARQNPEVHLGWQRGVTRQVRDGKCDERQEEVEENGHEGQGETDCPGATPHAPCHPPGKTDKRVKGIRNSWDTKRYTNSRV